ncbi:MAG TPA: hypothetical protein VFP84_17350 [Kofleriaceae bacterium]|nr:hypothetical protein [Kofleriaceae bacterium]
MAPQRRNLGWLGPAIVIVGAAVAGVGVWYMVHARPEAGAVIDRQAIDAQHELIVRRETTTGDQRAFVELREGDRVLWQALIPRYAGHPGATGLAWSPTAVSVRVIRDDYAEVFALAMHDASKLGGMRLAPQHGKVVDEPGSPISLTDHQRSYEIVAGPGWHQLVAIDLTSGKGLWSRELGAAPVRAGGVRGSLVWVDQGDGPRSFAVTTGDPVVANKL